MKTLIKYIALSAILLIAIACSGSGTDSEAPQLSDSYPKKNDAASAPTATPKPAPTATPKPAPTATPKPAPMATPKPAPMATPKPAPMATPKPAAPKITLLDAIGQGNASAVQQHMNAGTNPNVSFVPQGSPSWPGAAALHLAVIFQNKEIAQLLLDNGASKDIKAKDQYGGSPLQWAAFWGKMDMAEFMVNAGANINAKDNNGCTPLCAATMQNPNLKGNDATFKTSRASIRTFLISRGGKAEGLSSESMQGSAGINQGSRDTQTSGGAYAASTEEAPKLQNLLIKNLGPYNAASATFGDLRYNVKFDKLVLDVFGYIHNKGQPNQYDNPTFEFKAPADTVVIAPVSGKLFTITWQPSASYLQDDWDILIRSSQHSQWAINIDHIVSIDCDRSGKTPVTCDKPLRIGGQIVTEGMSVEAGQVLGYVGNWSDYNDAGINGRVELTLYKYLFKEGSAPGPDTFVGVMNHCPTMNLSKEVESDLKATITGLMQSYENWAGNTSVFEQEKMVAPGCLYTAIKEVKGKTTPVTN